MPQGKIVHLEYKAPTRCCELVCVGCGWTDVYVYYINLGTDPLTCYKCGNTGCLFDPSLRK